MSVLLPMIVRRAFEAENSYILGTWKETLDKKRRMADWGRLLRGKEYWALANLVVDTMTFPTCELWVGCHPDSPDVMAAWVATRRTVTTTRFFTDRSSVTGMGISARLKPG